MKKVIFFSVFTTIFFTNCQCKLKVDPDLIHEALTFAANILSDNPSGKEINYSVDFINLAGEVAKRCSCEDGTETADASEVRWNIYFNPTTPEPSNWGTPKDSSQKNIEAIAACVQKETGLNAKMLVSGYYMVENILDYTKKVKERDEDNNRFGTDKSLNKAYNPFKQNEIYGNNRIFKVYKVEILDEKPVYDEHGNRVYCKITKCY